VASSLRVHARERLNEMLEHWWPLYVSARGPGYCSAGSSPLLSREITEQDADGFLRGFGRLYRVEMGYVIQTDLMPKRKDGTLRRSVVFEKVHKRCQLRQETVPHFAAATELIFDYGWPKDQLVLESPPLGASTMGALDFVLFANGSKAAPPSVLAGEAKERTEKLLGFLDRVRDCGGTGGPHDRHSRSEHKKCVALLAFQPRLFLAVAAGYRRLFPVSYKESRFILGLESIKLPQPFEGTHDF
jgi:hypothetical protein